jgi:hypothetical protein
MIAKKAGRVNHAAGNGIIFEINDFDAFGEFAIRPSLFTL